jgi:hypothetical protein
MATKANPIAWRRLLDSAFTLHPEWTYTDQAPTKDLDKWEPLYASAPTLQPIEVIKESALRIEKDGVMKEGSERFRTDMITLVNYALFGAPVEVAELNDGWIENAKYLLDHCRHTIRVREGGGPEDLLSSLVVTFQKMQMEIERLDGLINTPHIEDFLTAVRLEAAHQRERWGVEHDAGKTDVDWFWLIGYLAGKALNEGKSAPDAINTRTFPPTSFVTKQLHHIITTAAACLNWHMQKRGDDTRMRPGIAPPTC